MTVGIVGMGYVGSALARILSRHAVLGYDEADAHRTGTDARELINRCDIAFVCVPTPAGADGCCDTSAVEEVLSWLRVPLIVIRSTMPADYEAPAHVVYQPEFIGESPFAPFKDEGSAGLVLVGGDPREAQKVLDFWKPVLGPRCRYLKCSWETAAQVKYVANCYQAVKTALWQEMLEACAEPDFVRDACLTIPTIEAYGTLPLGGVGGKCFPKDLAAFAREVDGPILKAALHYMKA